MDQNQQNKTRKSPDFGLFMGLGLLFGTIYGQFLPRARFGEGLSTGLMLGVVLWTIAERRRPLYPLVCITVGAVGVAVLGAILAQIVPVPIYMATVIGGSVGLVVGTILDVRDTRPVR
jgi:hypothetical protein